MANKAHRQYAINNNLQKESKHVVEDIYT